MINEHIGKRLRAVRKIVGLNQDAVAQKLEVTAQTLSRYEKGVRSPDSLFLQKFGRSFGINAHWMLYGEGDIFLKSTDEIEVVEDRQKQLKYYLKKIEELFTEQINSKKE